MPQKLKLIALLISVLPARVNAGSPVLAYGTYFGGSGDDGALSVAHTSSGELIVVGQTTSATLPGTDNAFQKTRGVGFPNSKDIFVAKFDTSGRKLLWATFLGGESDDVPVGLATDPSGNIFVVGMTNSSNFPVRTYISCGSGTIALQQQRCSSAQSVKMSSFIAKLSPDGGTLLYSVGLDVRANAITVDAQGSAYIATSGFNGVYLLRLDASGTRLIFSTFIGGGSNSAETTISSVVIDQAGNPWMAGAIGTGGVGLPTSANALQAQQSNSGLANSTGFGALNNGFIIELDSSGARSLYGTYLGPRFSGMSITGLVVNTDGSVYISGSTNADSFQATPGAYLNTPGRGFVAKVKPGATSFDAFSYLPTAATQMKLGADQSLHLILPIAVKNGAAEYLALQTPALSFRGAAPLFAASDLAISPSNAIRVVGSTYASSNYGGLFATNDALQPSLNGASDAFIIELSWIDPTVSLVASSATGIGSSFASGQLISIYGSQLGPSGGASAKIGADGAVTKSAGGTQVLFDGVAAPILYAGPNQVNAAIPCSVSGSSSTQMIVQYLGIQSVAFFLRLDTAAPGIFTVDGSGRGQAAVLNSDSSFNGPANPAARGSAVVLYATGIGAMSPCVDGQTYQSDLPKPTQPIVVGVGNSGVPVLYAGQAPFLMSGVAQINILIPLDSPTGSMPISLMVGGIFSPTGVTVAVK